MVDIGIRKDGETLPLIIRPKANTSAAFLREWVRENKEFIERKMLEHGEWALSVCLWASHLTPHS